MINNSKYDKDSIKVMSPIDHIRLRPSMYIPDVGVQGLHHLVEEILNNSVDEYTKGFGNKIIVNIERENNKVDFIRITDYGRGIPQGFREDLNMSVIDILCTRTLSGGKFDNTVYHKPSGLNGVGLKVVNALSSKLIMTSFKDGMMLDRHYEKGVPFGKELYSNIDIKIHGTVVSFYPDTSIFEVTLLDIELLEQRLFQISSIHPSLEIELSFSDNKEEKIHKTFKSEKPLLDIHNFNINNSFKNCELLFDFELHKEDIGIKLSYFKSNNTINNTFVNTVYCYDEGSQVEAIYKILSNSFKTLTGRTLTKNQLSSGLLFTLSLFFEEPKSRGQSKSMVADSRVFKFVYDSFYKEIFEVLKSNSEFLNYLVSLADAQEQIVKELEIKKVVNIIKNSSKENRLPTKLKAVYNCSPDVRELILCEGESAGGSIEMARNPTFQEVLPLRGKIINAMKTSYSDLLKSEEVMNIFLSIGGMEDSNTNLRTKKVFVLCDSDVDGSHIVSLILTLFASVFPTFVKKYELSVIQAPLYTLMSGDIRMYGHNIKDLAKEFKLKYKNKSYEIKYNKGLGEMEPAELVPVIDPKTRICTKAELTDKSISELNKLMGNFNSVRQLLIEDLKEIIEG